MGGPQADKARTISVRYHLWFARPSLATLESPMRIAASIALATTMLLAACTNPPPTTPATDRPAKLVYPLTKTVDQSDDFHGTTVNDPYRWMEDLDAPELKTWIDAENALVAEFLADAPGRARIKQRLTEIYDFERYGVPEVHAGRYFYARNDGLQNQSPWYWQPGLDGEARLLIDPNTLSTDGTVALSETGISEDGRLFAYSLSDGGSDWRTIQVRDVDSGGDLEDRIEWAKFTNITWAKDNSGFYYSRYAAPTDENQLKAVNKFQQIRFHRIGTTQAEDRLVYERSDQPDWGFGASLSDDGRYLVITVSQGTDERNRLFYQDLGKAGSAVVELVPELTAAYDFIGSAGRRLFVRSDDGAERYRVLAIDLDHPARADWKELIAEAPGTLTGVGLVNQQFIAHYLEDAHSVVRVIGLDGQPVREIALPGIGTATGFRGASDDVETFFSYASFTTPGTIYRYDAVTGSSTVFRQPKLAFDPAPYQTEQRFYNSKDGTRIPIFITAKRGLTMDGSHPTILYGYGGFNIPVTPQFQPATAAWLELGGVYAVANLRGGGEYGRAWHEAGMKTHKQNVFDDFAAAAEFLIAENITQPQKLAISGRSNGGLLVGATLLQRPELFGAALPAVGVLDMLRFREFTIGWAWESDYGTVKDAEQFKALHAYSPLHNIKPGVAYPPTLITTADHDDRVFPAHSFKFAAAMQAANPEGEPVLIRVETRAGHGAGKPTAKIIEEVADIYAFLAKTLDMNIPDEAPAKL